MKQFVILPAVAVAVAVVFLLGGLIVSGAVIEAQSPPNRAPVISGPATVTLDENSTTTIATLTFSDPDGDNLDISIPGQTQVFITADGVVKLHELPNYESQSSIRFVVYASDGTVSVPHGMVVTINDIDEPFVTTCTETVSYRENGSNSAFTCRGRDPETASVRHSLSGADSDDFTIDTSTGEVYFASSPDYESPTDSDSDNVYNVTVTIAAVSETKTHNVAVTVTNVNEAHTLSGPTEISVAENSVGVLGTYTVTDPDGVSPTPGLSDSGDGDKFTLTNGELRFRSPPIMKRRAITQSSLLRAITTIIPRSRLQ